MPSTLVQWYTLYTVILDTLVLGDTAFNMGDANRPKHTDRFIAHI